MDKQEWLNTSYTQELIAALEEAIRTTENEMIAVAYSSDAEQKAAHAATKFSSAIVTMHKVINTIKELPASRDSEEEGEGDNELSQSYEDVLSAETK